MSEDNSVYKEPKGVYEISWRFVKTHQGVILDVIQGSRLATEAESLDLDQKFFKKNHIKKYKKRPVEIEAVEYTSFDVVKKFCDVAYQSEPDASFCVIPTLEGDHTANVGDMIIKGVKGEFYPCRKDIFELTYDKVE